MKKELITRAITALRKQEAKAARLKGNGIDVAVFQEETADIMEEIVCYLLTNRTVDVGIVRTMIYSNDKAPEEVYDNIQTQMDKYVKKLMNYATGVGEMKTTDSPYIISAVNNLVSMCHNQSKTAGWHDKPREVGTDLMLIVSEIAEAMEGDRKGLMDEHLPHRKMFEVELADAVIRIFDTAGKHELDLGGAVLEKLEYNKNRADHKRENRAANGGKKY